MSNSDPLSLLGLALRAGRLAVGEDLTAQAITAHKARLLLLAADAAPHTVRRTERLAGERLPVAALQCNKQQLGAALGRESCAVCAVTDLGFATRTALLLSGENPSLLPIAQTLQAKHNKMIRRKKTKPRKPSRG